MQRLRILVVDDHPAFRAGVVKLLSDEEHLEVVGETSSGRDAIQLTAQLSPNLVLLDVALPDLSGAEVARRIVAALPKVKVLALSLHEDVSSVRALLDAGAAGYVCKRSAGEQLLQAVEVIAAGGTHVDPVVARSIAREQPSAARRACSPAKLSEREAEVLRLVASGHTAKEIASTLRLSPRTLETYKARGMSKLSLRTRADLIQFAIRGGWLRDS